MNVQNSLILTPSKFTPTIPTTTTTSRRRVLQYVLILSFQDIYFVYMSVS